MFYRYFVPQSQKLMIKIIDPLSRILASSCPLQLLPREGQWCWICDGHYIISTDCIVPCTFYCLLDCITTTPLLLLCWDSILWLRFITFSGWQSRYCKALWEGWSECYAPELLNSSDLHFMIANISSSPDQSRPSTQTSDPASDWSTQSNICLLIGQGLVHMLADLCDPSIPVESNSAHYVSPNILDWTQKARVM